MTTGVIGTPTTPSNSSMFCKTWSGDDGKYDILASGIPVERWNPYNMETTIYERKKASSSGNYVVIPVPPYSTNWSSVDDTRLLSKLTSAARGHDFNLAVNVAQGKMTVDMIVDNLSKLGRSFTALKHGNLPAAARVLGAKPRPSRLSRDDVSGRWLELQYGWLPLIGDTFEAAKAFERFTMKERINRVTCSTGRRTTWDPSAPGAYEGTGHMARTKRIIYEMRESLTIARSLGLLDPWSVVWEILPYSFVVDWFIPIGSYLDNLSVIPKLEGKFMVITMDRDYSRLDGVGPFLVGASSIRKNCQMTRTVTSSLPVIFPSFVSFPDAMSPKRIWNAIALAAQRFKL